MENITQLLPTFLLIFCRITAFFAVAPVFSFGNVPNMFKVGLAFFVSATIFSVMGNETALSIDGVYALMILKEILVGLLLGFTAYLFFTAVQVAGAFMDNQIGFGMVNVMDPMTGAQVPVLGNFKFFLAMLLFLAMNGHHYLLLALMNSYDWVPFDSQIFARIADGGVSNFLIDAFVTMFYLAFQIAIPLVVTLFLVDVCLGILAKTMPQLNMFVVGFPVKITVGFIMLTLLVSSFSGTFRGLFINMFEAIERLLQLIAAI